MGNNKNLRDLSWGKVKKFGLPINTNLPKLGDVKIQRTEEETINRLMCMLAVAASSYGFPRDNALDWIGQEGLNDYLEDCERQFFETGNGDVNTFKIQIEGMWALAWALNKASYIDFNKSCPNNFVAMLPDLKKKEPIENFRLKAHFRNESEIVSTCDLAYCLHWAIRQTELEGKKIPLKTASFVITERRRAFDWLISTDAWYEVQLDT